MAYSIWLHEKRLDKTVPVLIVEISPMDFQGSRFVDEDLFGGYFNISAT